MRSILFATLAALAPLSANATTIFADRVIEYFEPTVTSPTGPFGGLYDGLPNGRYGGAEYERVDLKIGTKTTDTPVTDKSSSTYVSLPTGAFIILGFSGSFFDGVGNDLFVDEVGAASETAIVSISSDGGATFTEVGIANGNRTNEFDLSSVAGLIAGTLYNAVKIEGTSNGGSSPGFDLTFVQALEGSAVPAIPLPAGLPLLAGGLGVLAVIRRRG